MIYQLAFSEQAQQDLIFHKRAGNKGLVNKIKVLLANIVENPFEGLGKPEPLKYDLGNKWSRRINREHRVVYEVFEDRILIHSLKGHYL